MFSEWLKRPTAVRKTPTRKGLRTVFFGFRTVFLVGVGFFAIPSAVYMIRSFSGEIAGSKLRVSTTAEYVAAHQSLYALKQSKCGYLVKDAVDPDAALQEIEPYLHNDELDGVISSTRRSQSEFTKAVNDTLSKLSSDTAACDKMFRVINAQVVTAKTKWSTLKITLTRSDKR